MSEPVTQVFTIPSNRIYLDTLPVQERESFLLTMFEFNFVKEWLYNREYNKVFYGGPSTSIAEIHEFIVKHFKKDVSGYYIDSLTAIVRGMVSSQKELNKTHIKEREKRIKNRKKKISTTKARLTTCRKFKGKIAKFHKKNNRYPTNKEITVPFILSKRYPETDNQEDYYLFECWLDNEIQFVAARIHNLEDRQRREEAKLSRIPKCMTFGGGIKFYKKKDTVPMTKRELELWHEERTFKRNKTILVSGKRESRCSNYQFHYNPVTKTAEFKLMDGIMLRIPHLDFPYMGEELLKNFNAKPKERRSVGYWLEIRRDDKGRPYLLVKATITLKKTQYNYSTANGVIAIDLNVDHIAWAELNKHGCRIDGGEIPFHLEGETSNQSSDILGRISSRVIDLCVKRNKPLAMEKINLNMSNANLQYGNKKRNRKISAFAYSKLTSLLLSKAFKNNVGVIQVNPAYTSYIAKVKYMKNHKGSIHQSAAIVIGRRAMGFSEKIPKYLKPLTADIEDKSVNLWFVISKRTKHLKKDDFCREIPKFEPVKKVVKKKSDNNTQKTTEKVS